MIYAIKTHARLLTRRSDFERWSQADSLSLDWKSRTEEIAELIQPNTSIIEFGAGLMILKDSLPQSCLYTPSDIVDRGAGTIVWDLNSSTLPDLETYDYAIFSGVLEYINDIPRLISHLSKYCKKIVASYAVLEENPHNRRVLGWVNDYSSSQLIEIFKQAGYSCNERRAWSNQTIFVFSGITDKKTLV